MSVTWPIFGSEIAFVILGNFRETWALILLGNIALSLKFELTLGKFLKTGLEHDTHELLCCLACDCNYRDKKLCDVLKSGVYCMRLYIVFKALGGFWSFLKLFTYISIKLLCTPGYKENHFLKLSFTSPDVISSSPKALRRAELIAQFFCYSNSSKHITCPSGKLKTEFTSLITKSTSPRLLDTTFFACCTQDFTSQISNWHAIAYRENSKLGQVVKLQIKFPAEKNTLTVDTDDQQFNFWWTFTNRQSKTNWQVEFERQAKEPTLSLIKLTFIYTNFLHFECDRFKVVDYFSSSTTVVNCQLLNILIKVSTQSISWAMAKNANFLKSCQLLLYVEFA